MSAVYAELTGTELLDNEFVHVQRLVLAPGRATGRPLHRGRSLQVFIRGGVLKAGESGREVLWKDGRVAWHATPAADERGWINAGDAAIETIWVSVKGSGAGPRRAAWLDYPNIPGEDLLENDDLIVQRFVVGPGQWEGVHPHGPGMLYIHIKGGVWAARSHREAEHLYDHVYADGEVGWMAQIGIDEGHESGNAGTEPIDLIWVTLKL